MCFKIVQEHYQCVKRLRSRSEPTGLNCLQRLSADEKVAASKEKVIGQVLTLAPVNTKPQIVCLSNARLQIFDYITQRRCTIDKTTSY